ncbi:MAG: 2-amino-4-hydroxy-6-hydroxymethyldihydropteridine diphosphokinase [Isosphaeraceae bacterium]
MGTHALVGLGSNLGDRKVILDAAASALRNLSDSTLSWISTYHQTKPAGGPAGQGPFLNAAAALETTLAPLTLLDALQQIEADAGRIRTVRWGERTLDLDLLLFGDQVIDTPELHVPHPRLGVRRFVLAPLEEIATEARDPLTGRSISALLANLDRRPSYLALAGWWKTPEKRSILERVIKGLNTGCWSHRDLEESTPNGWLGELSPRPFGTLEKSLEFMASPITSSLGDQWLVTDFTIDDLVSDAQARWGPLSKAKPGSLVRQFANGELTLVEPTFIVVDEPRSSADQRDAKSLLRSTPRLWLESLSPDQQVSEILAACASTRT